MSALGLRLIDTKRRLMLLNPTPPLPDDLVFFDFSFLAFGLRFLSACSLRPLLLALVRMGLDERLDESDGLSGHDESTTYSADLAFLNRDFLAGVFFLDFGVDLDAVFDFDLIGVFDLVGDFDLVGLFDATTLSADSSDATAGASVDTERVSADTTGVSADATAGLFGCAIKPLYYVEVII